MKTGSSFAITFLLAASAINAQGFPGMGFGNTPVAPVGPDYTPTTSATQAEPTTVSEALPETSAAIETTTAGRTLPLIAPPVVVGTKNQPVRVAKKITKPAPVQRAAHAFGDDSGSQTSRQKRQWQEGGNGFPVFGKPTPSIEYGPAYTPPASSAEEAASSSTSLPAPTASISSAADKPIQQKVNKKKKVKAARDLEPRFDFGTPGVAPGGNTPVAPVGPDYTPTTSADVPAATTLAADIPFEGSQNLDGSSTGTGTGETSTNTTSTTTSLLYKLKRIADILGGDLGAMQPGENLMDVISAVIQEDDDVVSTASEGDSSFEDSDAHAEVVKRDNATVALPAVGSLGLNSTIPKVIVAPVAPLPDAPKRVSQHIRRHAEHHSGMRKMRRGGPIEDPAHALTGGRN